MTERNAAEMIAEVEAASKVMMRGDSFHRRGVTLLISNRAEILRLAKIGLRVPRLIEALRIIASGKVSGDVSTLVRAYAAGQIADFAGSGAVMPEMESCGVDASRRRAERASVEDSDV